jgi:rRNA maturation endonuclease Nob1
MESIECSYCKEKFEDYASNNRKLCKSCHGRAEAEINKKLKNEVMKNA